MKHLLVGITALNTISALATGVASAAPSLAPNNGATLFRQKCQACHVVASGAKTAMGPNLAGIAGRAAGSAPFSYSPAMKNANIVWTKANLDKYLAGPAKMIPGTRMMISLPDAAHRKAIVDYLGTLR